MSEIGVHRQNTQFIIWIVFINKYDSEGHLAIRVSSQNLYSYVSGQSEDSGSVT